MAPCAVPDVWAELWAERGPAIKAAQLAAIEAEADTAEHLGTPA